ncbi:MAG: DUF268 domain-containing protein [Deltaproteobacteria bacterium]|nr:DUF268 domain-containing protein [Deltaproteobacteria bacterium]
MTGAQGHNIFLQFDRLAKRILRAARDRTPLAGFQARRRLKKEFQLFKSLDSQGRFTVEWKDRYPCLHDKTAATSFDRHYVFHTAWAARILAKTRPAEHVDIGSLLYFTALVSAFVPVRFYDYRPPLLKLSNLQNGAANLLALPFSDASIASLSCMHVVEHIGLGRYGDPIDPDGDLKAIHELKRVLAVGGDLLFVVPVGSPKIMFNAHRIYSYDQILDYFNDLHLQEFSLIEDSGSTSGLLINPEKRKVDQQTYGCGCFWFKKGASPCR